MTDPTPRPEMRPETRSAPRIRQSQSLEWRPQGSSVPRSGWLLESSRSGLAFAWRGGETPQVDTLIEINCDPTDQRRTTYHGRIRRATKVHSDLTIVAVEIWTPHSFPPVAQSLAINLEMVEPRLTLRTPPWCTELPDTPIPFAEPLHTEIQEGRPLEAGQLRDSPPRTRAA